MSKRYAETVKSLWSLAEEANIRANGAAEADDVTAYVQLKTLAENVISAVCAATTGALSDDELQDLADQARTDAIERIGKANPVPTVVIPQQRHEQTPALS